MSEKTKTSIYEVLPKLMSEIGGIAKDRKNQHQNYQFRGIDDVLNAVGPACAKFGVCVSPTIHDFEIRKEDFTDKYGNEKFRIHTTLKLRIEFTAQDGSKHVAEAIGEAMDTQGDKATNKAMSIAFKYACFMGLVIPVEGALDDSDNDDKQPESASKSPPAAPQKPNKPLPNEGCEKWEDWKVKGETTLQDIIKEMLPDDVGGAADEEKVLAFEKEKGEKLAKAKAFYEKKANEAKTDADAEYWQKGVEFTNQAITAFEKNPF